jgi:SpoVK/Ycf46/Vps4 family AAA+-type ATPase
MSELLSPSRTRVRYPSVLRDAVLILLVAAVTSAAAQVTNPIARRWARARVQGEEIAFLQQSRQISATEAAARTAAMNTELKAIQALVNALPRGVQADIAQQTNSLFTVEIVPLREQWKQTLAIQRAAEQARFGELSKQLQIDAEASGKFQAERTLVRERAQSGAISQAEAGRIDQQAEQQVLALHKKYDDLDAERKTLGERPYWAVTFARAEAGFTARAVAAGRLRLRLDDTQSEIGRDAHRAADLTLSMQRNQVFLAIQALTAQEAQSLNSTSQTLLATLNQKYATSAAAGDYRERVARLVQEGAAAQRPQWERDAAAAKQDAARRAAAPPPPSPAVTAPTGNPATGPAGSPVAPPAPTPVVETGTAPQQPGRPAPKPAAGRPAQRTAASPTVAVALPLPAPEGFEPESSIPWRLVGLVLLVGAGGAGAYVFRSRRAAAPPAFAPPPSISHASARPTAPALTVAAARVGTPAVASETGGAKHRILALQREKYQSRYNDALDEVTSASVALTEVAPLLEAAHANLRVLADSLYGRVHAIIVNRHGGVLKAIASAAMLRPVWRLFKRSGLLLKIGIGVALFNIWGYLAQAVIAGEVATVVIIYAIVVAVLFFVERYIVLKAPLALLKKNAAEFKKIRLSHLYADQQPEVIQGQSALRGMRIVSTDKVAAVQEDAFEASVGSGAFVLGVGALASYRMELSGKASLLNAAQNNDFVRDHGSILTEVVSDLGTFAETTFPPLVEYGRALWRKQRVGNQLPQLEALIRDVDRIEKIWEDTYVSDEVFESLCRSIDMFNMRDAATPPGILLYGLRGNGKKHLAQKINDTISGTLHKVTPGRLRNTEEIAERWASSRGTEPVVLFVPDAETVFPKVEDGTSASNTLEFLAEWEKHEPRASRVWVIMTARNIDGIDPVIVDHLGRDSAVEVQGPDPAGLRLLLQLTCRQYDVTTVPNDSILKTMGGMSVQNTRKIVAAAKRIARSGHPQESDWKQAIQSVRGADARIKDEKKTWDRLILPQKIKEQLQLACKILQDAQEAKQEGLDVPKILLYGPPGTGKTEIARTIANEAGVSFVDASLTEMKGKYTGHSGQMVKDLFARARASAPTVLFLDEIDAVAKERGSDKTDGFGEDITQVLLTELEGVAKSDRPVLVLAATNHLESLDDAMLSRFRRKIEIPKPDETGRREILKGFFKDRGKAIAFDVDEVATAVARLTDGQAGRSLRDLVNNANEEAKLIALRTSPPEPIRITRDLVMAEVERLRREGSDGVDPTATWEKLVVSDSTMAELRELSGSLRHMEQLQAKGIEPPRGAVLWGPPGTGKTQIAKTLANESGVRFLLKGPSDVGQTADSVRELFKEARKVAPCILFIDEFEGAGRSRDQGGNTDVVNELLSQMQGAKKEARPIFVLAATNYLDTVDKALLNRLAAKIQVPLPTLEQREKLFEIFLAKVPHQGVDIPVVAAELARQGGGLAGRDISDLVVLASQAAAQRAIRAGSLDDVSVTREDLVTEVADMVKKRSETVDPSATWDNLILSDETMAKLKQVSTALRNMDDRLKQGVPPPRGAVLFGPPGTGKTQIAKTLANMSGVSCVFKNAKDMIGDVVGKSPQLIARMFAEARDKSPCILFLDEFESAAASRKSDKGSGYKDEIVPQLLSEMEGAKATGRAVFVLAATNHLDQIDSAVLDRFTYQIEIPNPTPEQRERLFKVFLKKVPRVDFDIDQMAADLAKRGGNLAGRKIRDKVDKALQEAAQRADEAANGQPIVLRSADLLRQFAPAGRTVSELEIEQAWSKIVLKPEVKDAILGKLRMFVANDPAASKGLLLYGPSGTGKTEVARRIAESAGCHFMPLTTSDLKSQYGGGSPEKVREKWNEARAYGRCVMFVDECEGVFASRGSLESDKGSDELVREFLAMWDGIESRGTVWVVGATNHKDQIDSAAMSRFGAAVEIGLPGPEERLQILRLEMQKFGRGDASLPSFLADETNGFSGRELSEAAKEVCAMATTRRVTISDDLWREAIGRNRQASSDASDSTARWSNLVLGDDTIRQLQTICKSLKNIEFLKSQGRSIPRGALLYGPPGTGKTQIARTLANESGLTVLLKGPADIKAGYVGQSGKLVKQLFAQARDSSPCILFIDEFDSNAAARGSRWADQFTDEIVPNLLSELDGARKSDRHVFLLAATNHRDRIDPAIRDRFTYEIEVPLPTPEQRKRLFGIFLGGQPVDFDLDAVTQELADGVGDVGGREIQNIVRRAEQRATERAFEGEKLERIVITREDLVSQIG